MLINSRIRYGLATWVDARGTRTAIAQRLEGRTIVMELDAETLARTQWPAVLDPSISPEISVGPIGTQPAAGWQDEGRVIFDGLNYLAVWTDSRADDGDLYFSRVSTSGQPRDAWSLPLAAGTGTQHEPAMAFGGGVSLVAWRETKGPANELYAARLNPAGQILDATPLTLTATSWDERNPTVSFDGTNFLVAWLDSRATGSDGVYGVRVSPQGVVLDATPLQLVATASRKDHLISAGISTGGFVLVWADARSGTQNDLYFARLSSTLGQREPDGVVLDADTQSDVEMPSMATNGDAVLVTWTRITNMAADVYARRFSLASGMPIDVMPTVITNAPRDQFSATAVADGTGWLVGYQDDADSQFHLWPVDVNGALGAQLQSWQLGWGVWRETVFSSASDLGVFATGGDKVVLDWFDRASGMQQWTASFPVSSQTQFLSSVAGHPQGVLLASMIDGSSTSDPFGADVAIFPLDFTGASSGPFSLVREDDVGGPAIATSRTQALVVFHNYWGSRHVMGRRVGFDGVPIDPDVFDLATMPTPQSPRVASDGTDFLVVWHNDNQEPLGFGRVSAQGVLLDPNGRQLAAPAPSYRLDSPDVAFDGQRYVAVWRDDDDRGNSTVRATRITSSGVVDSNVLILGGNNRQWDPAVAGGPDVALVAWADERMGTEDIFAARLFADGGTPDADGGFAITLASGSQYTPSVTWDGARFIVAWVDERSSGTAVQAATVELDGTVSSRFELSTNAGDWNPRLASSGLGRSMVSYQRFTLTSSLSSTRTYVKAMGLPLSQGAVCSGNSDCASNFCVDGVCCDTACGGGIADCQVCSSGTCTPLNAGTVCRDARGVCDLPERCVSMGGACPPDESVDDGTQCGTGVCFAGSCEPGTDAGLSGDGGAAVFAITSLPPATASCNQPWSYQPTTNTTAAVTWRLRSVNGDLPPRLFINSESGEIFWHPTAPTEGTALFDVVATSALGVTSQRISVTVTCQPLTIGCSCAAGSPFMLAVLAPVAFLRRRKRVDGVGRH